MKNTKKKITYATYILLGSVVLTACAEVTPLDNCATNEPYGFWSGLLHGVIAPFSFLISLFKDSVAMYAVNNNGGWYNFGFLLGVGVFLGGSSRARR